LKALRRLLALAILVCAALLAGAYAADFNVNTSSSLRFSPTPLTIAPGDTVVFHNVDGGTHNVHFADGAFTQPGSPSSSWPARVARTFAATGTFDYHCDQHQAFGMEGVITVSTNPPPSVTPRPSVAALKLAHARGGAIKVRLRASTASSARITLARRSKGRFRTVKSLKRDVGDKSTRLTFKRDRHGKKLKPGRYRITVQLTKDGVKGPKRSARITLP
jgi:plastocyanin